MEESCTFRLTVGVVVRNGQPVLLPRELRRSLDVRRPLLHPHGFAICAKQRGAKDPSIHGLRTEAVDAFDGGIFDNVGTVGETSCQNSGSDGPAAGAAVFS